jgi:penicillin-binding protein 1A
MKPTDTIVDEPVTIDGWSPRNSTRTNLGPVTLREAFSRSINTISAKIGAQVGFSTIADMARRFGITTPISTYPSMVLGSSDVRLLDMTRAFASVANKGVATTPYGIRRVVTADGRMLYQREADEGRVLVAPWVAAEMTDLLQSAVLSGTGRAAQIGRPVAGKTGTTTSNKDGWFVGFSSGLTTGVWMGRDDARPVYERRRRQPARRAIRDPGADARLAALSGRRDVRRPGDRRQLHAADDGRRERDAAAECAAAGPEFPAANGQA